MKKYLYIYIILFSILSMNVSYAQDKKRIESEKSQVSGQPSDEKKQTVSLGMSAAEFKRRFNAAMIEVDIHDLMIGKIKFSNRSDLDIAHIALDDKIGITLTKTAGSKTIDSVFMYGSGDGSLGSGAKLFYSQLALVAVFSPQISEQERTSAAFLLFSEAVDGVSVSQQVNDILYTASFTKGVGYIALVIKKADTE